VGGGSYRSHTVCLGRGALSASGRGTIALAGDSGSGMGANEGAVLWVQMTRLVTVGVTASVAVLVGNMGMVYLLGLVLCVKVLEHCQWWCYCWPGCQSGSVPVLN
jgi:hypothetical protein